MQRMKPIGYSAIGVLTLTFFLTCRTQSLVPGSPSTASPTVSSANVSASPTNALDNWRLYTAPDKSFSVEVPCDLDRRDVSAGQNVYEYSCGGKDEDLTFFIINVVNMPDAEAVKIKDERAFERSIKESFPANRRVTKMVPITIEKGIGREILVTNVRDDMDNARARIILTGRHHYHVAVIGDMKILESPRAERFFSSFKPSP